MLGMFFTDRNVANFKDAKASDLKMFSAYYKGMLQEGIYLAPSQFEALFISAAHDQTHIDQTVQAAEKVMHGLKTGN
jgi:glutamate-1-semialdehyde 2,1-aminomutase